VDDDATDDIDRHIADEGAAGGATDRVAVMRVSVKDEIDVVAIDDLGQFRVAKQRILHSRFRSQGRERRCDVRNDHFEVCLNTCQREVEASRIASGANRKRLDCATGQRVGSFDWPETAARTLNAGKPDPHPAVKDNRGPVKDSHSRKRQGVLEGAHPQTTTVVVAEDSDDGQLGETKQLGGQFDLNDPSTIRYVTSDDQYIRVLVHRLNLAH
jgi:hypothetical protein